MSGVLVVDKPGGITSHQVVARVRRLARTRKVGHAGTLDPMATGVLVLGIERATRLLGHLSLTDKSYTATIRLGASTVTDDAEGDLMSAPGAAGVSDDAVRDALATLRGDLLQVPSSVSAIKVGGVRSYTRVRSGAEVSLPARPVRVTRFVCTALERVEVDGRTMIDCRAEVDCSTGTYVRALARDLGGALGCGGHLTALRRTRVGPFGLDAAQGIDGGLPLSVIPMVEVARRCFPTLVVDEAQQALIRNGRRLERLSLPGSPTAVIGPEQEFLALYRTDGADAVAEAVFCG